MVTEQDSAASAVKPGSATGSLRTKLFYGVGSVAFGVNDQSFSYFLLIFYNQVVGLPSVWVGGAIFVALLVDAFADPLIGQVSDNLRSRWGRRHPFMYASAIPVAIAYYVLWNPPHWSQAALFDYLVVAAIAVRVFLSFYEIPSLSLAAELTPDYDQRTSFLAWRSFFAWQGGLAMALLAFGVFFAPTKAFPYGQLNPEGYVRYSITGALVIAAVILISAAGTHRFIPQFAVPPKRRLTPLLVLREMGETLSHGSFAVLVVSALFSYMAAGTLTALNIYFQTYFWQLSAMQVLLITAVLVPGSALALVIATPLARSLGKRNSAIWMWVLAMGFYWAPLALRIVNLFPANGTPWIIPLLMFFGTIGTMFSIVSTIIIASMLADVVEDSQLRTGRRSEGLFFAANSLVQKSSTGAGGLIAGALLAIAHFPAHANPATLDPSIPKTLALVYFPTAFVLYGVALAFIGFYKIDRATHEENLRKLAADAAASETPLR
jgi:Na+/melibiose symporter-like transporter